MSSKKLILLIIILLILIYIISFPVNSQRFVNPHEYEEEDNPPVLFFLDYMTGHVNSVFASLRSNVQEGGYSLDDPAYDFFDHELIVQAAKNLLFIFLGVNFISLMTDVQQITPSGILKCILLFVAGYYILENYHLFFDFTRYVRTLLVDSASGANRIISMDIIESSISSGHPEGVPLKYELSTAYFYSLLILIMYMILLFSTALLYLRNIQLFFLQLLAPLCIATFGSHNTYDIGFGFLKKYFSIDLYITLFILLMNATTNMAQENFILSISLSLLYFFVLVNAKKFFTFTDVAFSGISKSIQKSFRKIQQKRTSQEGQ